MIGSYSSSPVSHTFRRWFASHPGGPIDYQVRDLTIVVDGAVAFCHSLNHLAGALWFRSTLGLRKIGGQ